MGGVLGGVAGGALVDSVIETIGPVDVLLDCGGLGIACAGIAWWSERVLQPTPRTRDRVGGGALSALDGARSRGCPGVGRRIEV